MINLVDMIESVIRQMVYPELKGSAATFLPVLEPAEKLRVGKH